MSIDDATPSEWDTVRALNNLSIRKPKKVDPVEQPDHYNKGAIEAIEAIMAATNEQAEGYLQGNIMKYVWRYRYKNGLEDLQKAQWYLNKLIEVYQEKHK